MKIVVLIVFLGSAYLVYCQKEILSKDYLVVFDANSNSFRQISLDESKHINLPRSDIETDRNIQKIIIQHKNELFKLHYIWPEKDFIGTFQLKDGNITEKNIRFSNETIRDFDKNPSQDIYYYSAAGLFKRDLASNVNEKLVDSQSSGVYESVQYNRQDGLLYYHDCSNGNLLKRLRLSDRKLAEAITLNQCLKLNFIDFQAQELFGVFKSILYRTKLDDKPDLKTFAGVVNKRISGFAIGSKHVYYTIGEHNVVYRLLRNSKNKEADKFYEFPNGDFKAIAIFEGDADIKSSPLDTANSFKLNSLILISSLTLIYLQLNLN